MESRIGRDVADLNDLPVDVISKLVRFQSGPAFFKLLKNYSSLNKRMRDQIQIEINSIIGDGTGFVFKRNLSSEAVAAILAGPLARVRKVRFVDRSFSDLSLLPSDLKELRLVANNIYSLKNMQLLSENLKRFSMLEVLEIETNNIRNDEITVENQKQFLEALQGLKHMKVLVLNAFCINTAVFPLWIEAMSQWTKLKKIDLQWTQINLQQVQVFASVLSTLKNLEELSLRSTIPDDPSGPCVLIPALQKLSQLKVLNFFCYSLSLKDGDNLVALLSQLSSLETLSLSVGSLEECSEFFRVLSDLRSLMTLNLYGTSSEVSGRLFKEVLPNLMQLKNIELIRASVEVGDVPSFIDSFKNLENLVALNLQHLRIINGRTHVESDSVLAAILPHLLYLETLDLSDVNLGARDFESFKSALESLQNLKELNLSGNEQINPNRLLTQLAIPSLEVLNVLDLYSMDLDDAECLVKNFPLLRVLKINIAQKYFSDEKLQTWAKVLPQLTHLECLNFGNSFVFDRQSRRVAIVPLLLEVLGNLTNLKELNMSAFTLSSEDFFNINFLTKMTHLEKITFSCDEDNELLMKKISSIVDQLQEFPHLEVLTLLSNRSLVDRSVGYAVLREIDVFSKLPYLRKYDYGAGFFVYPPDSDL